MEIENKRLAVLGSTGSVGRQTLDVVRSHPDRFEIIALAAGANIKLLSEQIEEFKPRFIYHMAQEKFSTSISTEFLPPVDMASIPDVDIVVVASAGMSGLVPTIAAAKAGKTIALANKESLVVAGEEVLKAVEEGGAAIHAVDSEHSAIWQCLQGEETPPSRLILTASGGPFRHLNISELERVTPEQALNHPSWRMGKKITVDSATMINKGLEVIEAHHLFGMPFEEISVTVHPESIIHSMVEFPDGTIKAQLGCPDMRIPIMYALSYPERIEATEMPRLDFLKVGKLSFEEPDTARFPGLDIAIEAGKKGGTYPAVLVGADETAVSLFLQKRIRFIDIATVVQETLEAHKATDSPSLEEIIFAEAWGRKKAGEIGGGLAVCQS